MGLKGFDRGKLHINSRLGRTSKTANKRTDENEVYSLAA
nr:MAG TPA: hypothetical protein [Caudoviricetes sp.]